MLLSDEDSKMGTDCRYHFVQASHQQMQGPNHSPIIKVAAHLASGLHARSYFHCRGMAPCLIGIVPYAGLDITAFELMKEWLEERYNGLPPPYWLLACGMLSSSGAQAFAYPFGFIRTRLQVLAPATSQGCIQGLTLKAISMRAFFALAKRTESTVSHQSKLGKSIPELEQLVN